MKKFGLFGAIFYCTVSFVLITNPAHSAVIKDTSVGLSGGGGGLFISSFVSASSFEVFESTMLTDLTVWLDERTVIADDGFLGGFSGTLSWGIFTDAGGPSSTIVASGTDSTLTLTDSGLNNFAGGDIVRVDGIDLGVAVNAGTYWLGLHEGIWLSPSDGTEVEWTLTNVATGSAQDTNETNPGFAWNTISRSNAFVLSGISAVPVPAAVWLFGTGILGLIGFSRGRKAAA